MRRMLMIALVAAATAIAPVAAAGPAQASAGPVAVRAAPAPAALGVDAMVQNWGPLGVGLICGVVTPTYNRWLPAGYNTPRTVPCQGYYVGAGECANIMRGGNYSAVNVGRGQHFFHIDDVYVVMKRYGNC